VQPKPSLKFTSPCCSIGVVQPSSLLKDCQEDGVSHHPVVVSPLITHSSLFEALLAKSIHLLTFTNNNTCYHGVTLL